MGATRPNPASPSDATRKAVADASGEQKSNAGGAEDRSDGSGGAGGSGAGGSGDPGPDIPLGVRVRRQAATGPAGQPGTIRVVAYDGSIHELEGAAAIDRLPGFLGKTGTTVWVDLVGPTQRQAETVGKALGLHPLIVEDVLEGNQRAKIETTDGVVHIVLFHLTYGDEVIASELDAVLGKGFLLTVHNSDWDPRAGHHLAGDIAPILSHGADHLLWAITDDLIDGYFPFADRIGDAIDDVQDQVVRKATPDTIEQVFKLKRELIQVRRAISPVREVFNQLTNRDEELIDPEEIVYFRDIYDHVIRLTDELDNYRELAAATLDVYLTQVNNNLSVIMKRLTGVTVILAGIGAVAGIFGMSEAGAALRGGEASGFWIITLFVLGIAAIAAIILRKIDWI
jgi:magnesium transporter